ncbi:hypothetical protein ACW5XF_00095 [Aeromonas lusitana]|uniref:Uncharacterized protein n=1 Tax=Aeromonas lusitana TaxID=931529 RepID=A0A2M8H7R5_9GAMM|nr:hypothetical protein [Aeromonas lusitana]PJC92590.1 hypothetical protein CUC44_13730 [Aeromonas lusitana]
MTSWIMWEIWWSRMWGDASPERQGTGLGEEEVAHEPSRLPVELIAQGKPARPYPPRPRG